MFGDPSMGMDPFMERGDPVMEKGMERETDLGMGMDSGRWLTAETTDDRFAAEPMGRKLAPPRRRRLPGEMDNGWGRYRILNKGDTETTCEPCNVACTKCYGD
jgi:hypothetical protein